MGSMETAIVHFKNFVKVNDDMVRVLILDISGLYTQIYDEFWCYESEFSERTKAFTRPDYICIRVE